MSKKIVLAIFAVFVILVAGGGFFWWWQGREIKGSPEDYVIKERTDGTFVENKKAGLTVKVPEGWEAQRINLREGWAMFCSPDTEIEWREDGVVVLPLEKGCLVEVGVMYNKADLAQIKQDTKNTLLRLGLKSIETREIVVNDKPALETIYDTQKIGMGITVNIPWNDKVYFSNLSSGVNKKEECVQELDKILETISIK